MCGLCGIIGNTPHWTDGLPASSLPDAPQRRRARQARIRQLNRVLAPLGLAVNDWQAHAYLLATLTGRQEIVDSLPHLWQAAARLRGHACDPLDEAFLARLENTRDA